MLGARREGTRGAVIGVLGDGGCGRSDADALSVRRKGELDVARVSTRALHRFLEELLLFCEGATAVSWRNVDQILEGCDEAACDLRGPAPARRISSKARCDVGVPVHRGHCQPKCSVVSSRRRPSGRSRTAS